MIFNLRKLVLCSAVCFPLLAGAQNQYSLQSAIDTALRNNFGIQIARNNADIARISNTLGMAGGLPVVSASAGDNVALSNTAQKSADGSESSISGKAGNSLNAGVSAGILLFNGFRVVAARERLDRLQELSEIELNQQIQNTVAGVMITFYDIVRQQNYLRIIQNTVDVSQQKLDIVKLKNSVGMANKVDLLQSQTDLNAAGQQLELQKLVVEQVKSDLLLMIGATNKTSFSVISDSIRVDESLRLDSIVTYLTRNPQFLSAQQQIRIDEQIVKEVNAQRYPSVKLSAGYDFYQGNFNKGNLLMSREYGPSAGASLQVPIFNGNIYKTQSDAARIRVENSKLTMENLYSSLITQAMKLHRSYSTTLEQIKSQRENFEMSKQLVDVVMQNFQSGQATILDVKAAQTSFETAAYLLVNLLYSAKVSEIELRELTYSLTY
jgi:outer membrane protein